jgi:hypothetical protein
MFGSPILCCAFFGFTAIVGCDQQCSRDGHHGGHGLRHAGGIASRPTMWRPDHEHHARRDDDAGGYEDPKVISAHRRMLPCRLFRPLDILKPASQTGA